MAFQNLRRNKMKKGGQDPGPIDKEPEIAKLIQFKPAHASFRKLQESYLDARLYLTELTHRGKKRLLDVQRELKQEQEQFQSMADQFMKRDGKLTDNILEEEKSKGGTNVAAMSRKGEIMKLFKEV